MLEGRPGPLVVRFLDDVQPDQADRRDVAVRIFLLLVVDVCLGRHVAIVETGVVQFDPGSLDLDCACLSPACRSGSRCRVRPRPAPAVRLRTASRRCRTDSRRRSRTQPRSFALRSGLDRPLWAVSQASGSETDELACPNSSSTCAAPDDFAIDGKFRAPSGRHPYISPESLLRTPGLGRSAFGRKTSYASS